MSCRRLDRGGSNIEAYGLLMNMLVEKFFAFNDLDNLNSCPKCWYSERQREVGDLQREDHRLLAKRLVIALPVSRH